MPPVTVASTVPSLGAANALLYKFSGSGKIWDLKPKIKDLVLQATVAENVGSLRGGSKFLYTPVTNDDEYLYYYDIWGNIAWGYIAASCGFKLENLQFGNWLNNRANDINKESDKDDKLSVEIGYYLFQDYGYELNPISLHIGIYSNRNEFTENVTKIKPQRLTF